MRPAENIAKPVSISKMGLLATLCARLHFKGSGAPNPISKLSHSAGCIRRHLLTLAALGAFAGVSLCSSAAAFAEEARPGWEVTGRFGPTVLHPGGYGMLSLYVFNTGAGSVTGSAPVLVNELPPGLEAVSELPEDLQIEQAKTKESGGCSGSPVVTCEVGAVPPAGLPGQSFAGEPELFEIPVRVASGVQPTADGGPVDLVSVRGGGALGVARAQVPVSFGSGVAPLGFSGFDSWLSNKDGTTDMQAGSHPYSLTVTYAVNSVGAGNGVEDASVGEAHALNVNLPPGLVGEPGAVPECTRQQFDAGEHEGGCPAASQIGVDYASISGPNLQPFKVFNMVPPPGIAAQFAFTFLGTSVFLDSNVRSGGDNGITTHINPVPERRIVWNTTTIWGFPGKVQAEQNNESYKSVSELAQVGERPLLTLPTSCGAPPQFGIEELGTWQEENAIAHEDDPLFKAQSSVMMHNNADEPVGITGCEKLVHFQPTIAAAPDTSDADSPAGLTASVRLPQHINPEGLATAGLQNTTVVLPEGMVVNPGQATGLQACQSDQDGLGQAANGEVNEAAPSCPEASKVGTDEIITPLLPDKLEGNVYIMQSNPPELKLLVAASGDGVNLKLVGTVHLNTVTGQLTTTFDNTPDAPFSEFKLAFSGGAQAALVTPTTCGVKQTTAAFSPWSSPFVGEAFDSALFSISTGPLGSPCANPMPFSPSLTAGSTTDQAGGYTDFSMLLSRGDGQQRFFEPVVQGARGIVGDDRLGSVVWGTAG